MRQVITTMVIILLCVVLPAFILIKYGLTVFSYFVTGVIINLILKRSTL